jgi:hypothetical protein
MLMRRGAEFVAAVLLGLAGAAPAQTLPRELQEVAQRLPAVERERLLQRQQRLSALSPQARGALSARRIEWDALPEEERRARREAWLAWRAIPDDERMRMRAARAAYEALPRDEQTALRARYEALDDAERRGWLLGPGLGRDWPRLHALFAQVPPAERPDLVQALRALSPQGRHDLAVLAQRTPPGERDALRRDLLALPMDARDAWLRSRVDPP